MSNPNIKGKGGQEEQERNERWESDEKKSRSPEKRREGGNERGL